MTGGHRQGSALVGQAPVMVLDVPWVIQRTAVMTFKKKMWVKGRQRGKKRRGLCQEG